MEAPDYVLLEPDGRLILSPKIMSEYILASDGCDLWFNDRDQSLAVKIRRDDADPAYRIDRAADPGGTVGMIETASFLAKVGVVLKQETETLDAAFSKKFDVLVVALGKRSASDPEERRGILDDFPALEG